MYRPRSFIAISKMLIGIMVFLASFMTATPNNINIDKVDLQIAPLSTQSTELEYTVTNHTHYALDYQPKIVKLERLDGDSWNEMELNPHYIGAIYELFARPFLTGSILPGETYEHHFQLSLLFPDETAPAGTYRLTVECKTHHIYYAVKDASVTKQISCEFTVAQA